MPSSTKNFYSDIHSRTIKNIKSKKIGNVISMAVSSFNNEKKSKKIIEIGCGYGQILYLLKTRGFKNLTGLDLNKQAISFIKKEFKFIKAFYGSALKIDIKKKYDIVLCNGVLHHTNSLKKGIKEIKKISKNNGKIVLGIYLFKNSLFDFFVKTLRILSFIFPYKITRILLKPFPIIYSDAILDHMYVPILKLNSKAEIERYFKENNLDTIKIYTFNPFVKKNRFLSWVFYNESFYKIYILKNSKIDL